MKKRYYVIYNGPLTSLVERIDWCGKNFGIVDRARWTYRKRKFWFRDEGDALLYKLRWL